ncbi:hypothetical protein PUN28_018902 [Cardiocondyla obscurior]|uniref:Uncharacterized protein n=1 Tax=Cardiocondyla obscurior TaxID=286306 RepID=A0AAW2EDD1_9HYME
MLKLPSCRGLGESDRDDFRTYPRDFLRTIGVSRGERSARRCTVRAPILIAYILQLRAAVALVPNWLSFIFVTALYIHQAFDYPPRPPR